MLELLIVMAILAVMVAAIMLRWMFNDQFGIVNIILDQIGIEGPSWFTQRWSAFAIILLTDVWLWTPWFTLLLLAGGLHGGTRMLSPATVELMTMDHLTPAQLAEVDHFAAETLGLRQPFRNHVAHDDDRRTEQLAGRRARQTDRTRAGDDAALALLLAIAPGPGMLYVLARTLAGGRRGGLLSSLGTFLGGMVHVFAAAAKGFRPGAVLLTHHHQDHIGGIKYLPEAEFVVAGSGGGSRVPMKTYTMPLCSAVRP